MSTSLKAAAETTAHALSDLVDEAHGRLEDLSLPHLPSLDKLHLPSQLSSLPNHLAQLPVLSALTEIVPHRRRRRLPSWKMIAIGGGAAIVVAVVVRSARRRAAIKQESFASAA